MAETFIFSPNTTDGELLAGINNDTKYVIAHDQYNINPTGWPDPLKFISNPPLIENLIKEYPNCCFIMDRKPCFEENVDNVVWLPMWWFESVVEPEYQGIKIDWINQREKTAHYLSGQYRISRVLTNFWLAKHYPLDQLLYTNNSENNNLLPIIDILAKSKFFQKDDISSKKFLQEAWLSNTTDLSKHKWFSKVEHPYFHAKSYLSFTSCDNGIELSTSISEKIYRCFLSGNFSLYLGNYKVHTLLKSLGFDLFEDIFNFDHLNTPDRYDMTVQGLRSNQEFCCDHHAVESAWFTNIHRLKENHKLSLDQSHWFQRFNRELKLIKHSLSLSTSGPVPLWLSNTLEYSN